MIAFKAYTLMRACGSRASECSRRGYRTLNLLRRTRTRYPGFAPDGGCRRDGMQGVRNAPLKAPSCSRGPLEISRQS